MKNLYESILSNIEDTLVCGDEIADEIAANAIGSNLRKMFVIGSSQECGKPFTVKTTDNKKVLTLNSNSLYRRAYADCDIAAISDTIADVDELHVVGGLQIESTRKGIAERLCKTIVSDTITIACQNVTDVNLIAKPLSTNKYLPYISFDQITKRLTNVQLEWQHDGKLNSRVVFNSLPEFKNVSSKTAEYIDITTSKVTSILHGKVETSKADLWNSNAYKNLFDFGYTLDCTNIKNGKPDTTEQIKINSVKDFRKLATNKVFYSREFSEWPVKLKKGAKLSDFIDISQFESLYQLVISDDKMGIIFENTNHPKFKEKGSLVDSLKIEMLKDVLPMNSKEWESIHKRVPVTADGYRVIIVRR